MLESVVVTCPYCWQIFETTVDCSAGEQCYVEDCQICCSPMVCEVRMDPNGHLLAVETRRENP